MDFIMKSTGKPFKSRVRYIFCKIKCGNEQTWRDYITNVINYDYLPPARLRLRINKITIKSITITLKVITITIAITFVLKHLQNENKTHLHGLM